MATTAHLINQVSDALLKTQKLPAGQVARAGYLADIGRFCVFDTNRSAAENP